MYDVIYIDAHGTETLLAQDLRDRDGACEFARRAAAERGAGRAMLPGSTNLRDCVCVLPSHPPLSSAA
jgi:hypothetical protein